MPRPAAGPGAPRRDRRARAEQPGRGLQRHVGRAEPQPRCAADGHPALQEQARTPNVEVPASRCRRRVAAGPLGQVAPQNRMTRCARCPRYRRRAGAKGRRTCAEVDGATGNRAAVDVAVSGSAGPRGKRSCLMGIGAMRNAWPSVADSTCRSSRSRPSAARCCRPTTVHPRRRIQRMRTRRSARMQRTRRSRRTAQRWNRGSTIDAFTESFRFIFSGARCRRDNPSALRRNVPTHPTRRDFHKRHRFHKKKFFSRGPLKWAISATFLLA